MDFVERVFGLSPDAGSGAYELLLFGLPIVAIGMFCLPSLRALVARRRHL